jgi:hypothetical protein
LFPHRSTSSSPRHIKALAEMTALPSARKEMARLRFLAALTDAQQRWLPTQAKACVDSQDGMRFVHDPFHTITRPNRVLN